MKLGTFKGDGRTAALVLAAVTADHVLTVLGMVPTLSLVDDSLEIDAGGSTARLLEVAVSHLAADLGSGFLVAPPTDDKIVVTLAAPVIVKRGPGRPPGSGKKDE